MRLLGASIGCLIVIGASALTTPSASTMSLTTSNRRRTLLSSSLFGNIFGGGTGQPSPALAKTAVPGAKGPTNEVIKNVNGMKQRRLGGSDIIVSELGLGTQRWVSTDFNAPNEKTVFEFMDKYVPIIACFPGYISFHQSPHSRRGASFFLDRAILKHGVNLLDTAEQYPIPSDGTKASEGDTELVIGKWMRERKVARDKVVIATKITGGRNVTPKNIKADCTSIRIRRISSNHSTHI
jgi:Aldo/keto reductase family